MLSKVFFQNQIDLFLDTLVLNLYFLIIKKDIFRGDFSNVLAKTATLATVRQHL